MVVSAASNPPDASQLALSPDGADVEGLIDRHRGLARGLARRFSRRPDQLEDLEQVAYLGLVKAAQRFDADRGTAFSTFAVPTVLGELRRFCRDTHWPAHVPRPVQERVRGVRKAEDALLARTGRAPGVAEVAALAGLTEEEVLEARLAASSRTCLSLTQSPDRDDPQGDRGAEVLAVDDDGYQRAEDRDELERALSELDPDARAAVRLRVLHDFTVAEVADRLGLTPSQASKLLARSLADLRTTLSSDAASAPPRHARRGATGSSIALTDVEPELFERLTREELAVARRTAIAPRVELQAGPWRGTLGDVDHGRGLGLLVASGVMLRSLALDERPRSEIIGPGDLIQSDSGAGPADSTPGTTSWEVVVPTTAALLDDHVIDRLCRWPSVMNALLSRAVRRSHELAFQVAVVDLRRAEDRLMHLFAHLGDRWGRRTLDGIVVPIPLTHEMLAQLVGAHRPTVTTSLQRLGSAGALLRRPDRTWLLPDRDASSARVAA